MQTFDHPQSKRPAAAENLAYAVLATDYRLEILDRQSRLIHTGLDSIRSIWVNRSRVGEASINLFGAMKNQLRLSARYSYHSHMTEERQIDSFIALHGLDNSADNFGMWPRNGRPRSA